MTKTLTPTPPLQQLGLYDPFLGSASSWQLKMAQAAAGIQCHVVTQQALDHLALLAKQFHAPAEGWRALHLTIPGFNSLTWSNKAKSSLLQNMLPSVMPLTHSCWIFILPSNSVLLVIFQPDAKLIVKLVYQLASFLVDEAAAPYAKAQLIDLHKNPQQLPVFISAQDALAEREKQALAQQQQQAVLASTHLELIINPAVRQNRRLPVVLVVEDDPSTALLLNTLLGREVECHIAHNAVQAITLYRQQVPNLVFLDLGLPDLDGLSLLQRIKAGDPAAHIVVLTANAYKHNFDAAFAQGAKGFLAKPFTREKIQQTLQPILKRK